MANCLSKMKYSRYFNNKNNALYRIKIKRKIRLKIKEIKRKKQERIYIHGVFLYMQYLYN